MKLIKDQIYGLKKLLEEIRALELDDVKFNYAMGKNLTLCMNECSEMDKSIKPSEKYVEYEKKRYAILRDKSEKDKNGNPILIGDPSRQQVKIDEKKKEEFAKEMMKLGEEYKEEIEKRNKMLMDFDKMLSEEVSEDFLKQIFKYKIIFDSDGMPVNLPKGLKQKYIDPLLDIILVEK